MAKARVQLFHVAEEFPCDLRQALLALRAAPPPNAVLRKATQAAGRYGASVSVKKAGRTWENNRSPLKVGRIQKSGRYVGVEYTS
jgi:hypothetical protein